MFIKSTAIAALVVLSTAPAMASSITDTFTSFWILGDSLSDDGNRGRATDGLLWNEPIQDEFEAAGSPHANLAYGGANVVPMGEPGILDLPQQVGALSAFQSSFGDTPLVSLWIGGNDAVPIALNGYAQTPEQFADMDFSLNLTVEIYRQSLLALVGLGVSDFLVFELPDVGDTPFVQAFATAGFVDAADVTDASKDLNSAFDAVHDTIAATVPGINFYKVAVFDLSDDLRDNPELFGATEVGPCAPTFFQGSLFIPAASDDCTKTTYWDGFHPTENVHLVLTDLARDALHPIPLPASAFLLLAGLGGLGLIRRRAA